MAETLTSPPPAQTTTTAPPTDTGAPSGDESKAFGGAFAELDALDAGDKNPPPPKKKEGDKPDPKAASAKPAEKKSEPSGVGNSDPETIGAPDATKPSSATEPPKPVKAAELRVAYEKSKERIRELETKNKEYEAKLKTVEGEPKAVDVKPFEEKLTALEKRNKELEDQIEFVNYSSSQKFQKEYVEPYQRAWKKATDEIQQLNITEEDGTVRQATANDFLALFNAPLARQDELAETWFGKSASRALRNLDKCRELAEAQENALKEAAQTTGTRRQQMTEQAKKSQETKSRVWQDTNSELVKKYPKFFDKEDGDEEGNSLLAKGYEYADSVFNGNGNLSETEKIERAAVIRNRSAAFMRTAHKLKKANAEIAELRAALDEYEKTEPPAGRGGEARTPAKGYLDSAMSELDALDKKGGR